MSTPKANVTSIDRMMTINEMPVSPDKLVAKRHLTLEATSLARLKEIVCRIDGELEQIDMPGTGKGAASSTAIACPITDVATNRAYLLICNSLIVSALQRAGSPLTGRYFAMRSGDIKGGKRYRQVEIMEMEVRE